MMLLFMLFKASNASLQGLVWLCSIPAIVAAAGLDTAPAPSAAASSDPC
jgi:hypothetical protein